MRPRFYLHIGTNKTGTSAIQCFLNLHRNALKGRKLLYPVTGCSGESHYELSRALGFSHEKKLDEREQAKILQTLCAQLSSEMERAGAQKLVISSEFFVLPGDVSKVRSFLGPYDVSVVVYFRRHDSWWESAYAQAVKTVSNPPWDRGIEAFIDWQKRFNPDFGDYRGLLDRWEKDFGKGNILVRPYERQQNRPHLIVDFFSTIESSDALTGIEYEAATTNESLSTVGLQLMDIFQRTNVGQKRKLQLVSHCIRRLHQQQHARLLSPQHRRQLIAENAEDYAYIARRFLSRDDGVLFYDDLPDADDPWAPLPELEVERVVEEALKAIG
jgi:hypothetical protein